LPYWQECLPYGFYAAESPGSRAIHLLTLGLHRLNINSLFKLEVYYSKSKSDKIPKNNLLVQTLNSRYSSYAFGFMKSRNYNKEEKIKNEI
jgi:hypothetical protein